MSNVAVLVTKGSWPQAEVETEVILLHPQTPPREPSATQSG